ncbi:MAG: 2-oxo acid dehydrogenase subunit E2, partial [Parachlamydiaceae bacterium]|nr:2-oxo acid dehydrogenase subunit E2 [Parachlamydiaceae bacterium]
MPFTLTMPKLSPTMEEGVIAKWHKKVGDFVEAGDLLLEVSTDKATVEHQALDSGWLRQVIVQENGEAQVNQPIAIFTEEKEESVDGYVPEGAAAKVSPAAPAKEEQPQVPVSQQAVPEVHVADTGQQQSMQQAAPQLPTQMEDAPASNRRIIASPLAKKLAAEQGLDLSNLKGTGPGGRIMKKDLAGVSPSLFKKSTAPRAALGSFVEEAMTPMRKVIAQRLQEAKATIPHFYIQQTIDAANLVALREQLKNIQINVTYNDLILKASALALKEHPAVNSGFAPKGGAIVRFKTIDIAVAVSVEGGLLTPIVRYADDKDVREISQEVKA